MNQPSSDPESPVNRGIAILAWGSLEWSLRELIVKGRWHADGPTLKLEFSRQSHDGRLTIVIDAVSGVPCQSGWWESGLEVLDAAKANLANREGTGTVGAIDLRTGRRDGRDLAAVESIAAWMQERPALKAVIWTDLKPKFGKDGNGEFTPVNAVDYLETLTGDTRDRALEYLTKAPKSIDTPVRRLALERGLIETGKTADSAPAG